MTLADALAPLGIDRFLTEFVGQQYVLIKGSAGKFTSLFSWRELDEALRAVRVNDDRVYLVKNAQRIPRDAYIQSSQSGRSQYLIGPSVAEQVMNGATLVVNQVDELFPAVRRLAESCEHILQIYVSGNLYAGWRRDKGFDVHWDSHDTLIVQVIGRKDWKVWRPTRPHPVDGDGRDVAPFPTEEPVWQGTLEDGDVLYMPRGWWHVACPRDEASLHVTFGLRHPTGLDFLSWVIQQLKSSADVRMDVPHWKSAEPQTSWRRTVRDACIAALDDDQSIDQFMESLAVRAHTRPIVYLPKTVSNTGQALTDRTSLRLVRGRRLHFRQDPAVGTMFFTIQGAEWRCHPALVPGLALLNHVEPCSLADMSRRLEEQAKPLLRPFISTLIVAGVIWAEPADEHLGLMSTSAS